MKPLSLWILIGCCLLSTYAFAGERHALLVGVSEYKNVGQGLANLKGPINDVKVLARLLKQQWKFDHITQLINADASKQAILRALDNLVARMNSGDHLLFYFSGHGTGPLNSPALRMPHGTAALLPYDTLYESQSGDNKDRLNSFIMGRWDLRPRLEALDHKGVYVTVWLDSCFSERATRGFVTTRMATLPGLDDIGEFAEESVDYEPYPYKNVITFSASAANEAAIDIDEKTINRYPTLDQQYHGAFSDALLRALSGQALPHYGVMDKNADQIVTTEEFFEGVQSFMVGSRYTHTPKFQSAPQATDLRSQPLFYVQNDARNNQPSRTESTTSSNTDKHILRIAFNGNAEQRDQLATLPGIELTESDADINIEPSGSGYHLLVFQDTLGRVADFAALQESLRRRVILEQVLSTAYKNSRSTVTLEMSNPAATTRLPLGTTNHSVETDLILKTDHDGYPLVIDLFGDGTLYRLYPNKSNWQNAQAAGIAASVFRVKTTPPLGIDMVYTFLLREPIPQDIMRATSLISTDDPHQFDLLMEWLSKQVLGADKLPVEIYQPEPGELEAWR